MKFVFRVDASSIIGGGHVTRCLRLAKHFRKFGIDISFITHDYVGNLNYKIEQEGFNLHIIKIQDKDDAKNTISSTLKYDWRTDASSTKKFLEMYEQKIDLLIVDSYYLDHKWEIEMKNYVKYLLVIDDLYERKHYCDLFLDQGFEAEKKGVQFLLDDCKKLQGTSYALLDPSFTEFRKQNRVSSSINTKKPIFVFFGTNDILGYTYKFTRLLLYNFDFVTIHAITSGVNTSSSQLEELSRKFGNRFKHLENVNCIAFEMSKCCLAVSSVGMVTWELMCLGIPALQITTMQYQVEIMRKLHNANLCHYLGDANEITEQMFISKFLEFFEDIERLNFMRSNGMLEIDGAGLNRVAEKVLEHING